MFRSARLALVGLVTLLAASAGVVHAADPAPALKIVAFGDSLTSGHHLPKTQAYPARLAELLDKAGLPFEVINHGLDSDTTAGALRRLDAVLAEQPDILILEFGANDGLKGVPVPQVRRNLETLIEGAQARGVEVLLVGMEALPFNGWQYTIDFHQMWPDLAAKYQVPLVPFFLGPVLGNRELMSSDGIHPNVEGAKILADSLWPYLRPMAEEIQKSKGKMQN